MPIFQFQTLYGSRSRGAHKCTLPLQRPSGIQGHLHFKRIPRPQASRGVFSLRSKVSPSSAYRHMSSRRPGRPMCFPRTRITRCMASASLHVAPVRKLCICLGEKAAEASMLLKHGYDHASVLNLKGCSLSYRLSVLSSPTLLVPAKRHWLLSPVFRI